MKLTIPSDQFIDPIMRAFETMDSENPDKEVIYRGQHTLVVLKEILKDIPDIVQRETDPIEKTAKMMLDVLKSVQREMDAAGDKAFDVLSSEVMGDIRHIINKIETEKNESSSETV